MTTYKKSWKKKLYENEEYPDNHTDKTFLEELKKNIYERHVNYQEAFTGSGLVIQEVCLVVLFCVIFTYLYNDWIHPEVLFSWSSLISFAGYLVYIYKESSGKLRHFRAVLMFLILGYLLSPVLKTLTESISTDTIFSTTLFMMLIHLIFFDYGVKVLIVSSSLSINAAIFGSVCLASRLATPFHAFVLLTCCVECFVLSPLLLSKIGSSSVVQAMMVFISIFSLLTISTSAAIHFIGLSIFINVICPILFVRWQVYKENIYGPWDEAVVSKVSINT